MGVPSVAEAAALAAAGPTANLIAARLVVGPRHARSPLRWRRREPRHDRAFHRRRAGRGGPDHGAWPRSHRALSGLPLCRLDRAARVARLLSGRCPHRRYGAAVARRDRGRVRVRARRRPRRGSAAFRRSLDLLGARRTASPARAARHSLYPDARRAGLRRRRRGARMRIDNTGSGAKRGADPCRGRASRMPERKSSRHLRQPARRSSSILRSMPSRPSSTN